MIDEDVSESVATKEVFYDGMGGPEQTFFQKEIKSVFKGTATPTADRASQSGLPVPRPIRGTTRQVRSSTERDELRCSACWKQMIPFIPLKVCWAVAELIPTTPVGRLNGDNNG